MMNQNIDKWLQVSEIENTWLFSGIKVYIHVLSLKWNHYSWLRSQYSRRNYCLIMTSPANSERRKKCCLKQIAPHYWQNNTSLLLLQVAQASVACCNFSLIAGTSFYSAVGKNILGILTTETANILCSFHLGLGLIILFLVKIPLHLLKLKKHVLEFLHSKPQKFWDRHLNPRMIWWSRVCSTPLSSVHKF